MSQEQGTVTVNGVKYPAVRDTSRGSVVWSETDGPESHWSQPSRKTHMADYDTVRTFKKK